MYGYGCIVLSNLPKTSLKIDGVVVNIKGGFRGFDAVPPGRHELIWERDSGEALVYELDLLPDDVIVCQMRYDNSQPIGLVELEPLHCDRYRQLAFNGLMGFGLWTYPQVWKTIDSSSAVTAVLSRNSRLHFVLRNNYGVSTEAIKSIRIAPNVVEFQTTKRNLAFKICPYAGTRFMLYVFMPSPQYPNSYNQELDPALWSVLYEIIDDWGDFD
ncbi:MAG: hypothetical protein WBG70_22455 [Spirulinaceae cyanobacterium]